jgi:cell division septation protein DedD
MIEEGLAPVRVTILSLPAGTKSSSGSGPGGFPGIDYWVQVGSFSKPENASWLKKRLESDYTGVQVKTFKDEGITLHRVLIGPFVSRGEAQTVLVRLNESGLRGFVKEGSGSY